MLPVSTCNDLDEADCERLVQVVQVEGIPTIPAPSQLARTLQSGTPSDATFDRYLPADLRAVAPQYWTPLRVAATAARWLEEEGVSTVTDIGSGVGKFCIAAALSTRVSFVGMEQRPRFVSVARTLCRLFDVANRVSIVKGTFGVDALPEAEAYYLFNPFEENLFASNERLDEDVELTDERFRHDVAAARRFLQSAPRDTQIITYNGFGGELPPSYHQVRLETKFSCPLAMWRKVH